MIYLVYFECFLYWNWNQAKRTELSSLALFEGMVDKYGLTPFATVASAAQARAQTGDKFSSFSAQTPLGALV